MILHTKTPSWVRIRNFAAAAARAAVVLLTFALAAGSGAAADPQKVPGVTRTEILIGNTAPYSGPVSALSVTMKTAAAYFRMINERGGIDGRAIRFLSRDDGYNPANTVEQTRKLVESDGVLLIFGSLGTPANTAVQRYLNQKKVPQLFVMTGSARFHDPKAYRWSMGWPISLRTEGAAASSYLLASAAGQKIAVLYQNDDFGRDFLAGLQEGLGDRWPSVIASASYEVGAPTIDSELIQLKASGATVLVSITTPKYSAQAIRRVGELGWKPTILIPSSSASVGAVMRPAGEDNGQGVLSWATSKDPDDPAWRDDPAMKNWKAFMEQYYPEGDKSDSQAVVGYLLAQTLLATLRQSGGDLSRENVMKQANDLRALELDMLLPGISIDTARNPYSPMTQVQMQRFEGRTWQRFGPVFDPLARMGR